MPQDNDFLIIESILVNQKNDYSRAGYKKNKIYMDFDSVRYLSDMIIKKQKNEIIEFFQKYEFIKPKSKLEKLNTETHENSLIDVLLSNFDIEIYNLFFNGLHTDKLMTNNLTPSKILISLLKKPDISLLESLDDFFVSENSITDYIYKKELANIHIIFYQDLVKKIMKDGDKSDKNIFSCFNYLSKHEDVKKAAWRVDFESSASLLHKVLKLGGVENFSLIKPYLPNDFNWKEQLKHATREMAVDFEPLTNINSFYQFFKNCNAIPQIKNHLPDLYINGKTSNSIIYEYLKKSSPDFKKYDKQFYLEKLSPQTEYITIRDKTCFKDNEKNMILSYNPESVIEDLLLNFNPMINKLLLDEKGKKLISKALDNKVLMTRLILKEMAEYNNNFLSGVLSSLDYSPSRWINNNNIMHYLVVIRNNKVYPVENTHNNDFFKKNFKLFYMENDLGITPLDIASKTFPTEYFKWLTSKLDKFDLKQKLPKHNTLKKIKKI